MAKKILLLGLGGTITAKMVNGSWQPGAFTEEDLVSFIPETKKMADLEVVDLQPSHWLKVARVVYEKRKDIDGVVITQGTDTMHYTSSALSFLLQDLPFPVVLTGSQVPPHKTGSDARRNLLDAFRVATETDIREVTLVFNSKIIRGNRAKKFREVEFEAFESVGMLPLGIVEHDIRMSGEKYHDKKGQLKFFDRLQEGVTIVKITPGMNPKIIPELINLGYKGLVLEGYGAGNVPIEEKSLISEIKKATEKEIPIVVSTQAAIGCSWMYLYECGKKALAAGAIPGHDMISETAMTKLMWALGNYPTKIEKIKEVVLKDIAGEISDIRSAKEKRIWEYSL
jgi:L-asparaginase